MTTPTPPTLTAPPTPPSRTDTANFAARGDAFLSWFTSAWQQLSAIITWVTAASADVAGNASSAATKAGEASASAVSSAAKAGESSASAVAAAASADRALAIYGSTLSMQAAVNTATSKAGEASASAVSSAAKAGEASASAAAAAASAAALSSVSASIPGQIMTNATPLTTDGSIVKTLLDGATTVANLKHSYTTQSPGVMIFCMTAGYSYNITDGYAVISGSGGVDTFYVGKNAFADASITGAGIDVIYLPLTASQYTMSISGSSVLLRGPSASDGRIHGAYVAPGTSLVHDKVVFADGWAYSNDIKTAITNGVAVTLATDMTTPATPPASAYVVAGPTPNNWLFADGRAVSRTDWPGLFARLGTKYGAGDGTTTFNLPAVDTTDKTVVPRSGVAGLYAYVQGF